MCIPDVRSYTVPGISYRHFCFPARSSRSFTLCDLLDKPWSQVSSILPPDTCLHFYHAYGSAFPMLVNVHRMLLFNSRSHAVRYSIYTQVCNKKSLRACSVRLEPTRSILVGTRTTYQATGDEGAHTTGNISLLLFIISTSLYFLKCFDTRGPILLYTRNVV